MWPDPYPIYTEDQPFWGRRPEDLTLREARQYFAWFTEHYRDRFPILLGYFDEELTGDAKADLLRIGAKVMVCSKQDWFSYMPSEPVVVKLRGRDFEIPINLTLKFEAKSMAVDIGMLVADYLLRNDVLPAHWELVTRPKRDVHFHYPVVQVAPEIVYEPKQDSIGRMYKVLSYGGDQHSWVRQYEHFTTPQDWWFDKGG